MSEAEKLLLKALRALDFIPNRPVSKNRGEGNTYSLAGMIGEHLRGRGIDPYSAQARAEVP